MSSLPASIDNGHTAGVDEAGRGPLAGPVVAAAVILDPHSPLDGLADSKLLSAARREELSSEIRAGSLAWAIAWSDPREIDAINILNATLLAMRRAVLGLSVSPKLILVDGNRSPAFSFAGQSVPSRTIVGGDKTEACISAASILAKVERDRMMVRLDDMYPQYRFAGHKGYGTATHRELLQRYGPCREHRRSFRPLSTMLDQAYPESP